ncbi:MAG: stage III sporulation protein AB [Firmicutes bacterium]|nr:stage III sporulation protein AB [Bacillota bacterium]
MEFTVRLFIVIIIVILCGYSGYAFGNFYRRRKKFLDMLVLFCKFAKNEINFSHSYISNIIEKFVKNNQASSVEFASFLLDFKELLAANNTEFDKLANSSNVQILTSEEIDNLIQFLNALGKSDVFTQLTTIDNFLETFKVYRDDAEAEHKKWTSLYFKLGILLGLAIGVIFI